LNPPVAPIGAELRRLLPLILALAMAGPLTLNILQPAMPGLTRSLDASRQLVQLTLSLYILAMGVAQLIAGPLADRFGRRPVILVSLALYCLSSLMAWQAGSIVELIVARIGQAMGATACLGQSRTVIADLSDRTATARMIAYVTMAMMIAPMASPNIGAFLDQHFGWRSIFLFCVVFGGALLIYTAIGLSETRPAAMQGADAAEVARRSRALMRNPAFLRYTALSALASSCFFTMLGASPHLIIDVMGHPPADYGYWFITMSIGYGIGNFITGRYTPVMGLERMAALGNVIQMGGILIIGLLALVPVMHAGAVFGPGILIALGNGLVLPNVMAAGIQTDRNAAGAGSGLMGFWQLMLAALASYGVTLLPDHTALSMAAVMLTFSLAAHWLLPFRFRQAG
jgi:DHA1 family bicyclomycin/chloramphenicol resistance-like MFS transporter